MKVLVLPLILSFVFEQILGAREQDAIDALYDLETVIVDIDSDLEDKKNNYTKYFLEKAEDERREAEQLMNNRLLEVTDNIKTIIQGIDAFDNINITECTQGVVETLPTYLEELVNKVKVCVDDIHYPIGLNVISTYFTKINWWSADLFACTFDKTLDCKNDDGDCYDWLLRYIAQKKLDITEGMALLAVDMLNSVDDFDYSYCKDRYVLEFNHYSSDVLKYVRSCVDRVTKNHVNSMSSCN